MQPEELMERARQAAGRAYAPYSGFAVGAALACEDGSVYTGCNVEGCSFGNAICAERVALVKAVSDGHRRFAALAVAGGETPCVPCGICRQMLLEFAPELRVYCAPLRAGDMVCYRLDRDLLPHGFGPDFLAENG